MGLSISKKADKTLEYIELIFKFMFLTLVMLSFNSFIAGSFILKCFSYITVLVGAFVVLYRLLNFKKYYKTYGVALLVAFVVSYGVSSLINIKYGLLENIQAMVWMVLQFGILYAFNSTKQYSEAKQDRDYILKYFILYVSINNIISLIMLVKSYGAPDFISPTGNNIGLLWGRLWGAYTDPNIGSVFCVAAIIISIFYAKIAKKVWLKIVYILEIVISFLYIVFSDSRTGMLCLIFGVGVFTYFMLNAYEKIKTKNALKQIACVSLAIVVAATSLVAIKATRTGYNLCAEQIYLWTHSDSNNNSENPNFTIGREGDELEEDVSNRRFDLWQSGFEIWETSPVFGTSHRAITEYARENVPDTYLVNNDLGEFNSTHNLLFDILVSQGIVGAVIFLAFVISIIVLIFKKVLLVKNAIKDYDIILSLTILLVFALSSMFIVDILYVNSAGSFIFWFILGQLVHKLTPNTIREK